MTTDLIMLTASAVLTGALVLPYGLAMWALWPVREVLGNRETPPPLPPWAERARRAQHNMLENFPHFAALVLVVNAAEAGLVVGQSGGVHHEHEGGEVREVLEHVVLRAPCPLGPWRQGRRGLPVPEDLSHGPERPHGEAVRKHQGAGENGARGQHDQVGGHIVLHSTSPSSERRIIVRLNAAIQRTAG